MLSDIRFLGQVDYAATYAAMQRFTLERREDTADSIWICEHQPVYTQGLSGKVEHIFDPGNVPVVQTNRGGQVTYHGPGQVIAYPLVDLKRAGYFVKEFVYRIEEALIRTLMQFGVTGHRVAGAPGIYVRLDDPRSHALLPQRPQKSNNPAGSSGTGTQIQPDFTGLGKIGALGLKVSRNCTYHGVALNVAMDLEPYSRINPCGYQGLQTVDLSRIGVTASWDEVAHLLSQKLTTYLA